jgi:hypothetical protein
MTLRRMLPIAALFVAATLSASLVASPQEPPVAADVWAPLRFFVGSWTGAGEGTPGASTGEQTFAFVLRGAYLQVRNRTIIAPQEKNPKGEVHEDWGLFSFDKTRRTFVLRQFHVEGFVNQYVLEPVGQDGKILVFISEATENIPAGFKARLTYKILDADTFEQTFDLAAPGQDFQCYSKGVMKRTKGEPR